VIVTRWAAFTGGTPVEAAGGLTFDDLRASRQGEAA
jgi:hypothetical protein